MLATSKLDRSQRSSKNSKWSNADSDENDFINDAEETVRESFDNAVGNIASSVVPPAPRTSRIKVVPALSRTSTTITESVQEGEDEETSSNEEDKNDNRRKSHVTRKQSKSIRRKSSRRRSSRKTSSFHRVVGSGLASPLEERKKDDMEYSSDPEVHTSTASTSTSPSATIAKSTRIRKTLSLGQESYSKDSLLAKAKAIETDLRKIGNPEFKEEPVQVRHQEVQTEESVLAEQTTKIRNFLIERMANAEIEIDEVKTSLKEKDSIIVDLNVEVKIIL
jgi:hypothetical protein